MTIHRVGIERAIVGCDAASGFGWVFYFGAAVSQICTPDKDIAFLREKFCFGNVSGLSRSVELSIIAVELIASGKDPSALTAEEEFGKLMTARIVDKFAATGLNVLERG